MKSIFLSVILLASVLAIPKFLGSNHNVGIINGKEAEPHSHPFQVFMTFFTTGVSWTCTGNLITQNYILTSADCTHNADKVEVILGVHDWTVSEETQVRLNSTDFKSHENFTGETFLYNIGVVKLPSPVDLTDAIQLISLTDGSVDYTNATGTASSWGLLAINATSFPTTLQELDFLIISNDECKSLGHTNLDDSFLCVTSFDNSSLCAGDTGSPLVVDNVLVGLGAFTGSYCLPPAGYTRITHYLEWIQENTDYEINSL